MWDYFWPRGALREDGSGETGPVYIDRLFECRFRMHRELFDRFLVAITADSDYIRAGLRPEFVGKIGLTHYRRSSAHSAK